MIDLPAEAASAVCETLRLLRADGKNFEAFTTLVESYERDALPADLSFYTALDGIAKDSGVNYYTLQLLFLTALTPHLKEIYAERSIGEEYYVGACRDLKWKAVECLNVYGVWGSFVSWWQIDFFRLKLFAIGRLQFEVCKSSCDYSKNGRSVAKGDNVIHVHIPSAGPLKHDECLLSYREAEKFFRRYFPEHVKDEPITFMITSWLVYPANRQILPPESNIIKFMNDFDVFSSFDSKGDLWRIFNRTDYDSNPSAMPRDTSLRRAYLDWLEKGNNVGEGNGIFFYKDGKML